MASDPATDVPDLVIPADRMPSDGRFGCGPSKVRREAVEALAMHADALLGTSHRQRPVKGLVARLREGLSTLFDLPEGHEVLLANGGATAFWDAATYGLVQQRSQHEVFGEFSGKFATAVDQAPWLDEAVRVTAAPGTRPEHAPVGEGVDLVALTHNETSTGVMATVERPEGAAAGEGTLVMVDATSGAGGLPVDPEQFDVYYFSLQKGFASDGGLVVALASPWACERIGKVAASGRHVPAFFDLTTVLDNSRKDQTYNTPALATLFLAAEQVDWMLDRGGLDAMVEQGRAKADAIYGWAEQREWASPFVEDREARSLVVATIDLDGSIDADRVNEVLRANGILDTDAYRKLGRNQLRVGMFPAVDLADVQAYTACVDWVVEQLG